MASVFLSYDRDDTVQARPLALALEKAGHSVWWDRNIRGGAKFSAEIEQALAQADAVVVLWSERSIHSDWVRDEAASGRDRGLLVPVALDDVQPPLGFRQYQTIQLATRNGRRSRAEIGALVEAIAAVTRPVSGRSSATAPSAGREPRHSRWAGAAAAGVLLAGGAAGLFIGHPWRGSADAPSIAIAPADESAASQALARDLLVQLGSLQASNSDPLELVDASAKNPDLKLQVSGSLPGNQAGANVALFATGDRAMLWSRDYVQPSGSQADLRQQVAYSAAQLLGCASEAMHSEGGALKGDIRRLYLNGCVELTQSSTEDVGSIVKIFDAVVRAAPRFSDGWSKLLLAESDLVQNSDAEFVKRYASSLNAHINAARRVYPDLPEIHLAQITLLPPRAYARRLSLADAAQSSAPDDPQAYFYRSMELAAVGRMSDSVRDAEQASRLDPLSPKFRSGFIKALAYSGRQARAEEALKESDRLWPGAWSTLEAKFRVNLRYGDPAVALQILRANGTGKLHEAFLEARIDPNPANVGRVLDMARAGFAENAEISGYSELLSEFGREEEAYATIANHKGPFLLVGSEVFFRPNMKRFRNDPRFMQVANLFGLVDYWRSSGNWPDFCREPDLPYDCRVEAGKLTA